VNAVTIPEGFTKMTPKGARILIKVQKEEAKTRGGLHLPSSAVQRPTCGKVISIGDGKTEDNVIRPFSVKEGQTVLFTKYGFNSQEIVLSKENYLLLEETDVVGILPTENAIADDILALDPINERVIVRVDETPGVTTGGVHLPESAKEQPLSGTVLRSGPGRFDPDQPGQRKSTQVKADDRVLYHKYAGDKMQVSDGSQVVILRDADILCKA